MIQLNWKTVTGAVVVLALAAWVPNVVVALAAATAAVVASKGLETWREQLQGRTHYELARRLLRTTYRVREEFKRVRNPWMPGGEMEVAAKEVGLDDTVDERQKSRAVYDYRWRFLQRALNALNVESLEAEVVWGPEADEKIQPLRACAGDLFSALTEYLLLMKDDDDRPRDRPRGERKRLIGLRRTIHAGEDDELTRRIEAAVEGIEEFVRPHLELSVHSRTPELYGRAAVD